MNFFLITLILPLFGTFIPYLWVIPLLTFVYFVIRLFIHERAFDRKKQEVEEHISPEHRGLYLLLLSDEEMLEKGLNSHEGTKPRDQLLKYLRNHTST